MKELVFTSLFFISIILAFIPFITSVYVSYLFAIALVFALAALGVNLLLGYTGLLSFGHSLFFGVGAYSIAILIKYLHTTSLEILIPISMVIVILVSLVIGVFTIRSTKVYFSMLTLAFSQVVYALTIKFRSITGGDDGLRVEYISLFGYKFHGVYDYYYLILLIFGVSVFLLWRIINSPFGKSIQAIRDNEKRVEAIGINTMEYKLIAFIISGFFTGLAGIAYAPLVGQVTPEGVLSFSLAGELVAMCILGGYFNFTGPIVGGIVFVFLKAYLSPLFYWALTLGSILIVLILFFPYGIVGKIDEELRKHGVTEG